MLSLRPLLVALGLAVLVLVVYAHVVDNKAHRLFDEARRAFIIVCIEEGRRAEDCRELAWLKFSVEDFRERNRK
jgi:hypothetical protein